MTMNGAFDSSFADPAALDVTVPGGPAPSPGPDRKDAADPVAPDVTPEEKN